MNLCSKKYKFTYTIPEENHTVLTYVNSNPVIAFYEAVRMLREGYAVVLHENLVDVLRIMPREN